MRQNWVKQRLREGQATVGTWLSSDSTVTAELMAQAGFDWLVVDMEHGPFDLGIAAQMMQAIRATQTIPLARVGWNEPALIQQTLDLGAYGLIVPMINSRQEAEQVVQSACYPPLGQRSRGGVRARLAFGTDAVTYGRQANEQILLLLQVETRQSLEAIDQILAVPGVDGIFVGPNDLSDSLGAWPPRLHDEEPVLAGAIAEALAAARRHDKVPGIMVPDAAMANRYLAHGYTFVSLSSELGILEGAAKGQLGAINRPTPPTPGGDHQTS